MVLFSSRDPVIPSVLRAWQHWQSLAICDITSAERAFGMCADLGSPHFGSLAIRDKCHFRFGKTRAGRRQSGWRGMVYNSARIYAARLRARVWRVAVNRALCAIAANQSWRGIIPIRVVLYRRDW